MQIMLPRRDPMRTLVQPAKKPTKDESVARVETTAATFHTSTGDYLLCSNGSLSFGLEPRCKRSTDGGEIQDLLTRLGGKRANLGPHCRHSLDCRGTLFY